MNDTKPSLHKTINSVSKRQKYILNYLDVISQFSFLTFTFLKLSFNLNVILQSLVNQTD